MNLFTKSMKNHVYLRLSDSRQFLASVALAGSFVSSLVMSTMPVALAEDNKNNLFNNFCAFLTAKIFNSADEDTELTIENNGFLVANNQIAVEEKPEVKTKSVVGKRVIVTAYSSTPDQTDDSPFITANGTYVCDGIIATNFLPFGTKVKFPEYSGDKVYTVQDRMAKKNSHKIDIWMPSRQLALNFGVKTLAYEVME